MGDQIGTGNPCRTVDERDCTIIHCVHHCKVFTDESRFLPDGAGIQHWRDCPDDYVPAGTAASIGKVGNSKWGLSLGLSMPTGDAAVWGTAIEAICDACVELSATATGALIVVERQTRLGEQIDNGTILNATPSKELFGNIFYPKTPLHDGAVIMRDGMILAAACFLPKPQKEELVNKKLGSRHRAAIGMSENSDAIVIVVSEETGSISVAENGLLKSGFTREQLKQLLTDRLIQTDTDSAIRKAARKIPFIKSKKEKEQP